MTYHIYFILPLSHNLFMPQERLICYKPYFPTLVKQSFSDSACVLDATIPLIYWLTGSLEVFFFVKRSIEPLGCIKPGFQPGRPIALGFSVK